MKKKAFSLIELLISLITISVILASLAPVVTHKLKHGGVSVGTKKLSMTCPNTVGSECTLCLGNQCIACPIGCGSQFKNTLTCKCESCNVSNCANCNSGANQCDRCSAGYQKNGNTCQACSGGYYSNEGGTCQKCAKGTRSNSTSASTGCTNCTGNEYQDQEGQSTCKTCNPGFVSDSNRKCTTCAAGSKWNGSSCENCPVGYYSSSANTTTCTACSSGTYQNETGKTSCKSCNGANQYQDSTGQSSCKTCGANSTPNAGHTGCSSTCQTTANCTGNQYLKDNCTCTSCPSGQTPNSTKTGCQVIQASCSSGQYYIESTNSCGNCPTGCKTCTSATSCSECTNTTDYKLVGSECKAYKYPTSQADCDKLSNSKSIYIPLDVDKYDKATLSSTGGTHGFCMAKRNAGDLDGPDVSSAVKEINAGDSNGICSGDEEKCCWIGYSGKTGAKTTAKPNTTENGTVTARYCNNNLADLHVLQKTENKQTDKLVSTFNYEACQRTVCNWYAAVYICSNYAPSSGTSKVGDWGLPSKEALDALKKAIDAGPTNKTDISAKINIQKWSGANGLQLCQHEDKANTFGSPRCDNSSRCYGAYGGCSPNGVWGQSFSGPPPGTYMTHFYAANLLLGSPTFLHTRHYALSVRCVLEKYIE